MIEEKLIAFLNENGEAPAFGAFPDTEPDNFYLVERSGGGSEPGLDRAILTIMSYAPNRYASASLDYALRGDMLRFYERGDVAHVRHVSSCCLADPRTKRERYQAVYEVYSY